MFRAAPALVALLMASGHAMAQSTTASEDQSENAAAAQPAVELAADTVLAVVDDTPITLGEVISVRQSLPEQYQQLPDEVLITALVQQLSDQQLLANAGHAAGLRDLAAVQLSLRNQERAVMADAYMAKALLERVNEETIQAAYTERFVDAPPVEEVHAAHILVETEEQAAALKARIDDGADFAALAAEAGTDGTASRGGDLGWFIREQMVPEFADAVFSLETGTISGPVQSPFGWHLIKLNERRDRPVPALAEVQEQLIGEMTEDAQTAILEELRAGAKVENIQDAVPAAAVRQDGLLRE